MEKRWVIFFFTLTSFIPPLFSVAHAATSALMEVTVTVVSSCAVEVSTIDFGRFNGERLKKNGVVKVSCNNGVPYAIGMDAGLNFNQTSRVMVDKSGNNLPYRLSYAGLDWGDKSITDTYNAKPVTAIGNGTTKTYKVEAMIWPNLKAKPGIYKDTVTVTVAF